ncbi:MAG: ribonuclease R [Rhodobacteraceae bacterium]|nr:ribonuclease R [Paracoccaceae bacterium]
MTSVPSKAQILDWIAANPAQSSKRDIARAFGLKGAGKVELKRLLRDLADEGALEKKSRRYREAGSLPPVAVLVLEEAADGDLVGRAAEAAHADGDARALYLPRDGDPALKAGDRILAKIARADVPDGDEDDSDGGDTITHHARLIRKLTAGPRRVVAIYRKGAEGGRLMPIDKGAAGREWMVSAGDTGGARDGELVEAVQTGPRQTLGLQRARITARLGDPTAPRAVSLIAIHAHGIPDDFPEAVLEAAEAALPLTEAQRAARSDLRHLPLITIDPEDARDHDDAVCALPDEDPANPGGHVLWVAIADVAHYVPPGSRLDREARLRGNSTYFPDRVVPMLPESLSGDLCSLHEGAERPCIALRVVLDAAGHKLSHRFVRGVMRSPAALTYEQVQAARDGAPDAATGPLVDGVIAPLFAAWEALAAQRDARAPLALDLPERRIALDDAGRVASVGFRPRLDTHRLIEDCMVLANVCAAETLERAQVPLLYRVHEEPSPEKLDGLREIAESAGLTLAKGQVLRTSHLNRLLEDSAGTPHAEVINLSVLRAMTQAYYAPQNYGHFGLALARYAHFTSPIRRYADLVVHRALIRAHRWGGDGLSDAEIEALPETGEHISTTERRSMAAERDTTDRYLAAYLSERVGGEFTGRISGVTRFGLFVRLDETGADALAPIAGLGQEYFHYDRDAQTLMGERSGRILGLGMAVTARLKEAQASTGGILVEILEVEDSPLPPGATRGGRKGGGKKAGPSPRRKAGQEKASAAKARKIARRQRH